MGFDRSDVVKALQKAQNNTERALDILLSGGVSSNNSNEEVLILDISQYTFAEGSSACTAIAGSVLKLLLRNCASNLITNEAMLTSAMFDGVGIFNEVSLNQQHLGVEELGSLFSSMDSKAANIQGLLNGSSMNKLFADARISCPNDKHIGIIIIKPPETVCVVLPPVRCANGGGTYYLFDSHARPQLGYTGAYLVSTTQESVITDRLNQLFRPLNLDYDEEVNSLQMMYNMFEASVFQSKM